MMNKNGSKNVNMYERTECFEFFFKIFISLCNNNKIVVPKKEIDEDDYSYKRRFLNFYYEQINILYELADERDSKILECLKELSFRLFSLDPSISIFNNLDTTLTYSYLKEIVFKYNSLELYFFDTKPDWFNVDSEKSTWYINGIIDIDLLRKIKKKNSENKIFIEIDDKILLNLFKIICLMNDLDFELFSKKLNLTFDYAILYEKPDFEYWAAITPVIKVDVLERLKEAKILVLKISNHLTSYQIFDKDVDKYKHALKTVVAFPNIDGFYQKQFVFDINNKNSSIKWLEYELKNETTFSCVDPQFFSFEEVENLSSIYDNKNIKYFSINDLAIKCFRGIQVYQKELDSLKFERSSISDVKFLKISDINENNFIKENLSFIEKDNNFNYDLYLLKKGDVVMSARSTIFKIAVYDGNPSNVIASDSIVILRLNENMIDPYYVLAYLLSNKGRESINDFFYGTSLKTIFIPKLKNLKIPFTTIEKQQIIANRTKSIINMQLENNKVIENANKYLRNIFDEYEDCK